MQYRKITQDISINNDRTLMNSNQLVKILITFEYIFNDYGLIKLKN